MSERSVRSNAPEWQDLCSLEEIPAYGDILARPESGRA